MSRQPAILYRYRGFSTATLDSLCHNTLHFAHLGTFNDPLDCNPSLDCDSDIEHLRALLALLVGRRVSAEVLESLQKARVRGKNVTAHAESHAQAEVARELADIVHHATNPEYLTANRRLRHGY